MLLKHLHVLIGMYMYVINMNSGRINVLPLETFNGGSCHTGTWNDYNTGIFTTNCGTNDNHCCQFRNAVLQSKAFNTINIYDIMVKFCIKTYYIILESTLELKYAFNDDPKISQMQTLYIWDSYILKIFPKYQCITVDLPEYFNNQSSISIVFQSYGFTGIENMIIDDISVIGEYISPNLTNITTIFPITQIQATPLPTNIPTDVPTKDQTLKISETPSMLPTNTEIETKNPTESTHLVTTNYPSISPLNNQTSATTGTVPHNSTAILNKPNYLTTTGHYALLIVTFSITGICALSNCILCIIIYLKRHPKSNNKSKQRTASMSINKPGIEIQESNKSNIQLSIASRDEGIQKACLNNNNDEIIAEVTTQKLNNITCQNNTKSINKHKIKTKRV